MQKNVEINTDLVKKLIKNQFPQWANLPVHPVKYSGWDNRTFRLGDWWSVRLPSHERYAVQVAKEHRWLPVFSHFLQIPIPKPVAIGRSSEDYPLPWSIYLWIEGESAAHTRPNKMEQFAHTLGTFILDLHQVPIIGGPLAGDHNFHRGGDLNVYHAETMQTIASLGEEIDGDLASEIWHTALQSAWQQTPVWVHGDIAASNLLISEGELSAVIDFGCMGVGDPACDLTIAWTYLDDSARETFRETIDLDEDTWARARGWALWKALITLEEWNDTDPVKAAEAKGVIQTVMKKPLTT